MANDLKFVDSVATSPTTLLDLNDQVAGGFWLDTLEAPPPQVRRGLSDAVLSDGQIMSTSAYDNRTVSLALRLLGTSDQTALAIQKLGRIINTPQAVLRWLPQGSTLPVFFRVIRSPFNEVDETLQHLAQNTRRVQLELMADPAAYGLPVSGSVVINNDPVAATNPCFWDIGSSVKGDLETPLFITTGAQTDFGDRVLLVASSALGYGLTQTAPFIVQLNAASITASAGFTTGSGDAAMSGGNYYRYTSTGAGAQTATLLWNAGNRVLGGSPIGDYRVLLRYRTSTPGDAWQVSLSQWDDVLGAIVTGDAASTVSAGSAAWMDLGVFRFPFGATTTDDVFGTTPPTVGNRIQLNMTLPAGGAVGHTFDFDCLMFVPAGLDQAIANRLAIISSPTFLFTTSAQVVLDGINDETYVLNSSGQVGGLGFTSFVGGLPTVVPGCHNSLTWIRQLAVLGYGLTDSIAATTTLNWKYWPRYLYVRPAST